MSVIYYFHCHPSKDKKHRIELSSSSVIPYDYDGSGYFSDVIYHSRNTTSRFYIVAFGYEKSWMSEPRSFTRNRYIIHFIFDGKGGINHTSLSKGQIYIVQPNVEYTIYHDPDNPMTLAWISLSGKQLELMMDVLHLPMRSNFTLSDEQLEEIEKIFIDTIYRPHDMNTLPFFMFGRFFEILTIAQIPYYPIGDSVNSLIDQAEQFIYTHYSEDISVTDIAKEVHLSVSRLRGLFAAERGYSPQQALIDKRMEAAKAMLQAENRLQIQTIASACGYSDQSSFSKRFKKEVGMTPTEYIEKYRT